MKTWVQSLKSTMSRRLAIALIAAAAVGTLATFHFAETAKAASSPSLAAPAPAAAALDDNSVAALLSLDRAMETLAARVTPAVVNVTVASKGKAQPEGEEGMPDMQQFFGPDSPFGQGGNPFGGGRRQFRFQSSRRTALSTASAAASSSRPTDTSSPTTTSSKAPPTFASL